MSFSGQPAFQQSLNCQRFQFGLRTRTAYSERRAQTRSELKQLIRESLCAITNEPNAAMRWARGAYIRDVVTRYRVRIEGWPLDEVPFESLSHIADLQKLELLLRAWRDGTIYFQRISEAELQQMIQDPSPWIGVEPPPEDEAGTSEEGVDGAVQPPSRAF